MSISAITKKRGRPVTTGKGAPITVRAQPEMLANIDAWAALQGDKPTRPEAIRRLIEQGLAPAQRSQDLVAEVRAAAEDAVAAIWEFYRRPMPDGGLWGAFCDTPNMDAARVEMAANANAFAEHCRSLADVASIEDGASESERRSALVIAEIYDTVTLVAYKPPAVKNRRRRNGRP